MYIRKSSAVLFIIILLCISFACSGREQYRATKTDLNGTWVHMQAHKESPRIKDWQFSWGIGKRIVETTFEIDIQKNRVLMPGTGLFLIKRITQTAPSRIVLEIKGPGEEGGWEMKMVFHFLDQDTFWLECPDLQGQFAVGKKRPWYRLSGPGQ